MKRFVVTGLMAIVGLLSISAGQASAGQAPSGDPAIFDVGAGKASINPDTPQYPGGYGYKTGPFLETHDPLEMRAFVVGKGDKAAAFVVGDLVGWFSAYRGDELAPFGIDKTRERIAKVLNDAGYTGIDRSSVIVSTTHTHAAPSVVGIWGLMDPSYLKKVADGAVAAVQQAVDTKKTSEIWTATGNIRSFIWQNGQGTNHPDGFSVDEDVPIMWARDPDTGATNALYANVPNHPDQYNGKDNLSFSADWPGYTRANLDALNGGTSVIAAGTLGRQEPPGSDVHYSEVEYQGQIVVNQIQRAMAKAAPLVTDNIAGAETPMSSLADNSDLLLGMNLFDPPAGTCIDVVEICTIPRSTDAPYLTGDPNNDPDLGTNIVGIRIGDVSYSTNPGEAFPEVNSAIRSSITNDLRANVVGNAGDMLGYYYVRDNYTGQQFGSSDFEDFNVGPNLAQQNADVARENAAKLGFETTPQTVHADFNASVASKPGIQFYTNRIESADPTISIYGGAKKSQDGTATVTGKEIEWNLGDGTLRTGPADEERFSHTYAAPGKYKITAKITANNGKTRSWSDTVIIDPPLEIAASVESSSSAGTSMLVSPNYGTGQGRLVSATWSCGGTTLYGLTPVCPGTKGGTATVTAADGAGNTATTSVEYPATPKLKVIKVKLSPKKPKAGKGSKLTVKIKNVGGSTATDVKVCAKTAKAPGSKAKPGCKKLGGVKGGKSKTGKFTIKLGKKVKKKFKVKLTVTGTNVKKVKSTKSYKPKPVKK